MSERRRSPAGFLSPSTRLLFETASIVVIDDTPDNVTLLDTVLAKAGAEHVHGFTDPRAALAACRDTRPDLVLVDLHMPHLDAVEVIAKLTELLPDGAFVPVLVLTADIGFDARQRVLAAGAKDYLTKPFDITEVLLRAANLLETNAVYRRREDHNLTLRTQIEQQEAAARAADAEHARRNARLDGILGDDRLQMVFQPIVDSTGAVVGVEALARFDAEPHRPPNEWFAEAASVGRGVELELAAVRAALGCLDDLPPSMFLSVNASPATVCSTGLADLVAGADGERIVVEITEHDRVEDYDRIAGALDELRARGVRVAVDDTGAGYAGLTHLLRLDADILKLDIALTRGIDHDPVRRSLAAALVTFAADTDAHIVAEGVETAAELAALDALGVRWAQGFHLCRPQPLPIPARIAAG
jgi:EAL domain-containing protein (putative c-di-GMP-specific phosphodiesterase class I)